MPILVDGHNLIARLPGFSLQDPDDEEWLVRRLASFASRAGKAISVVFDPGEASALAHRRVHGGVRVFFAPPRSSADGVILRRILDSQNPREWLVVTSDQELAGKVSRLGARVRSSDAFAAELGTALDGESEEQDAALTPREVEAWLDLFGTRKRRQTL